MAAAQSPSQAEQLALAHAEVSAGLRHARVQAAQLPHSILQLHLPQHLRRRRRPLCTCCVTGS